MFIRATKTGTAKDGSLRKAHRLVKTQRHGQAKDLAAARFACSDNATIHVRTTATPDAIQTKFYQDMGLSPPLMNVRKVTGLTGN